MNKGRNCSKIIVFLIIKGAVGLDSFLSFVKSLKFFLLGTGVSFLDAIVFHKQLFCDV